MNSTSPKAFVVINKQPKNLLMKNKNHCTSAICWSNLQWELKRTDGGSVPIPWVAVVQTNERLK